MIIIIIITIIVKIIIIIVIVIIIIIINKYTPSCFMQRTKAHAHRAFITMC